MDKEPKLLIIEDEVDLVDIMKYQFQKKGYTVETACDGIDALEKLANYSPDLILLDINMPRMDGIEFYKNICDSNNYPKYAIFVVTARANIQKVFENYKVEGFMIKPFELSELIEEVNTITRHKQVE